MRTRRCGYCGRRKPRARLVLRQMDPGEPPASVCKDMRACHRAYSVRAVRWFRKDLSHAMPTSTRLHILRGKREWQRWVRT